MIEKPNFYQNKNQSEIIDKKNQIFINHLKKRNQIFITHLSELKNSLPDKLINAIKIYENSIMEFESIIEKPNSKTLENIKAILGINKEKFFHNKNKFLIYFDKYIKDNNITDYTIEKENEFENFLAPKLEYIYHYDTADIENIFSLKKILNNTTKENPNKNQIFDDMPKIYYKDIIRKEILSINGPESYSSLHHLLNFDKKIYGIPDIQFQNKFVSKKKNEYKLIPNENTLYAANSLFIIFSKFNTKSLQDKINLYADNVYFYNDYKQIICKLYTLLLNNKYEIDDLSTNKTKFNNLIKSERYINLEKYFEKHEIIIPIRGECQFTNGKIKPLSKEIEYKKNKYLKKIIDNNNQILLIGMHRINNNKEIINKYKNIVANPYDPNTCFLISKNIDLLNNQFQTFFKNNNDLLNKIKEDLKNNNLERIIILEKDLNIPKEFFENL
jgi:hypothetical protein